MLRTVRNQEGIALFLVLWVLTLLSVIVGEFCHAMRTELRTTRNFKEETEAYYIALAGVNAGIAGLVRQERLPKRTVTVETQADKEAEAAGGEGEAPQEWRINVDLTPVAFGSGQFEVRIENESGRVDLNAATGPLLRMLLDGLELDESDKDVIVDSILDWRDEDDLHRISGAEDDYYKGLPKPYPCKDAPFESLEELLLVRGVTPELFGALRELLTVGLADTASASPFGPTIKKKSTKSGPAGRINVNAASERMLRALPQMTDDAAARIVEYRREKDLRASSELLDLLGSDLYAAISQYITFRSGPNYTVRAVGKVAGSRIQKGVKAQIQIDRRYKKGYRLLQWRDDLEYVLHMGRAGEE